MGAARARGKEPGPGVPEHPEGANEPAQDRHHRRWPARGRAAPQPGAPSHL